MAERPDPEGGNGESEEPEHPETAPPPDDEPAAPESPWTKEKIQYMVGDELLAIVLRNGPVGEQSVPIGIAGPFLYRFHELTHAIAASLRGIRLGQRGPLPPMSDAGLLGLRGIAFQHSVTFHLGLGAAEQTQMSDMGDIYSITEDVLNRLEALIEAGAAGDPESLWITSRSLEARVGDNYERLLAFVVEQGIDTVWQFRDQDAIDLSSTRADRAKELLDLPDLPAIEEELRRGYLYIVNAREHKFNLDPEEPEEKTITGFYPAHLREEIRAAWDNAVEVRLRTTRRFLRRQVDADDMEYELLEVVRVLEP